MQNYQLFQYYPIGNALQGYSYCIYPLMMIVEPQNAILPSQSLQNSLTLPPNEDKGQFSRQGEQQKSRDSGQKKGINETQDLLWEKCEERNMPGQKLQTTQYVRVSNRNILPNTLNLLLSYIRRINKSGKIVERIIGSLTKDPTLTTKKFFAYQNYVKEKVPFHKTKQTLFEVTDHQDSNFAIFTQEEQQFYNKVCRILIAIFLKEEYICTLLSSNKIHKTSKKDHLKIRRYLQLKLQRTSPWIMEVYRMIEG